MTKNLGLYFNIPQEMKEIDNWVMVRGKRPYAVDGTPANTTAPPLSFEEAVSNIGKNNFSGIGFRFTEDNNIFGIDIDNFNDLSEEEIQKILKDFKVLKTYGEWSQSGFGVHFYARGDIKLKMNRRNNVEVYTNGRFFVVTGNILDNSEKGLNFVSQSELDGILEKYWFKKENKEIKDLNRKAFYRLSLEDRYNAFLDGSWRKYYEEDVDQSRIDYAFIHLLFEKGITDYDDIVDIFKKSSLDREKLYNRHYTNGDTYLMGALKSVKEQLEDEKRRKDIGDSLFKIEDLKNIEFGTDSYAVKKLLTILDGDLLYNTTNKAYMRWLGTHWEQDSSDDKGSFASEKIKIVKNSFVKFFNKFKNEMNADEIKECEKFIKKMANNSGVKGIAEFLSREAEIQCKVEDFDNNEYLLNTSSGLINMKIDGRVKGYERALNEVKSQISRHTKDSRITVLANANLDTREPKKWVEFIKDTMRDNEGNKSEELYNYLHKVLGYCITGDTKEQCFFILYGDGGNGKSVVLNIMERIFTDYSSKIAVKNLTNDGREASVGQANSAIASLTKSRLVITSETKFESALDEQLIKDLTGGDSIRARFLYKNEFTYRPKFKIVMATNYMPYIRGNDDGIWRRPRPIPFNNKPKVVNKDLESELMEEKDQILWWCIQGAVKYQLEGLDEPEICKALKSKVKEDNNVIMSFVRECCYPMEVIARANEISEKTHLCEDKKTYVWNMFRAWRDENNIQKRLGRNGFERLLERENITAHRLSRGEVYTNLRITGETIDRYHEDRNVKPDPKNAEYRKESQEFVDKAIEEYNDKQEQESKIEEKSPGDIPY